MSYGEKAVYLPIELLAALGDDPATWYPDIRVEPIICDAIRAWIAPAPPAQSQQSSVAADAGYQWKQLFLPDGTRLRAKFGRETWHATVQDGEIKYGEHLVSPSCFANLHGSGNRNAWKAVWLRFPGTEQWVLADTCRTMQKAAIARLFSGAAVQDELPSRAKLSPQPQHQPQEQNERPARTSASPQSVQPVKTVARPGAPPAAQQQSTHADDRATQKSKGKNQRKRRRKWHVKSRQRGDPKAAPPVNMPQA